MSVSIVATSIAEMRINQCRILLGTIIKPFRERPL